MFAMTRAIMWDSEDNFWSWLSPFTFGSIAFEKKNGHFLSSHQVEICLETIGVRQLSWLVC